MKTTIAKLWSGEVYPLDEPINWSAKEKKLVHLLEKYEDDLLERLDKTGRDILEKLQDAHSDLQSFELVCAFEKGFTLATKLMVEVFADTPCRED